MFAVFETGGKQYAVRPGDVVKVEKLNAEGTHTFDAVLLAKVGDKTHADADALKGAQVTAEVLETSKQDKVLVFKKKRRNNYRRLNGHRQILTTLRIKEIAVGGTKADTTTERPKAATSKNTETPKAETKPKATKAPAKQ